MPGRITEQFVADYAKTQRSLDAVEALIRTVAHSSRGSAFMQLASTDLSAMPSGGVLSAAAINSIQVGGMLYIPDMEFDEITFEMHTQRDENGVVLFSTSTLATDEFTVYRQEGANFASQPYHASSGVNTPVGVQLEIKKLKNVDFNSQSMVLSFDNIVFSPDGNGAFEGFANLYVIPEDRSSFTSYTFALTLTHDGQLTLNQVTLQDDIPNFNSNAHFYIAFFYLYAGNNYSYITKEFMFNVFYGKH